MKFAELFRILAALAMIAAPFSEASCGEIRLGRAPLNSDPRSLQRGAKLFVDYCLGCHGVSFIRYQQLSEIGFSDREIREELMSGAGKSSDSMKAAIRREEVRSWLGAAAPDLSVLARSRSSAFGSGADWLYSYLHRFYRDEARPTGWNNDLVPGTAMPHVLWELQGERRSAAPGGRQEKIKAAAEYAKSAADLAAFLAWAAEPHPLSRMRIGWLVLAVLAALSALSYALKRAYWKNVY